jgi:hypothetical protein
VIGKCSRCGIWGEVDLVPVANGGQRIFCSGCAAAPLYPAAVHPVEELAQTIVDRLTVGRVTDLWAKMTRGTASLAERDELETALTVLYQVAVDEHDPGHAAAASRALGYVRTRP